MSEAVPGAGIATAVAEQVASAPPPATAAAAVQTIRTCRGLARVLWEAIEAKVLEACWVIRREHPDRPAFVAYVARQLDGEMDPERAWLAAETWDVARSNRRVRELAVDRPTDAMDFVAEFVREGREAELKAPDSEIGRRSVEILTAPKKKRDRMLHDLLDAERAAKARRHPDDVRTIERQALELDDLRGRVDPRPTARQTLRECLAEMNRIEGELAEVAGRLAETAPAADGSLRLQLQVASDSIDGRSQELAEALLESEEG